jgi:hypothetical protein
MAPGEYGKRLPPVAPLPPISLSDVTCLMDLAHVQFHAWYPSNGGTPVRACVPYGGAIPRARRPVGTTEWKAGCKLGI